MLPRLQPPKGRPPPQKLKLDTQFAKSEAPSEFTGDVMASMYPPTAPLNGIRAPPDGLVEPANGMANGVAAPQYGTDAQQMPPNGAYAAHSTEQASQNSFPPQTFDTLGEKLGMNAQDWYEAFRNQEIETLRDIGEGSGGMVRLCRLKVSPQSAPQYLEFARQVPQFALKEIPANPDPKVRKQVLRELQFNRSCKSPYIVNYYGAFLVEECGQIYIAMEYCDGGSLDGVLKQVSSKDARIGERVLASIATGVLEGITYLYSKNIIHRDIKPQNILLSSNGSVKLCDFGVSGEVVNSLVTTFTGTSYYMAPERIRGQPYTVTSDVWSLGLTLMELAMNEFPFSNAMSSTPIELLTEIVNSPSPQLKKEEGIKWSSAFQHFLQCCLEKESTKRPSPQKMLAHPWIKGHRNRHFDMGRFVREVYEQ